MMTDDVKHAALEHALREYPRESCGVVLIRKGRTTYAACRNLAVGTDQFALDPNDYAKADAAGEIIAIVHSHPNLPATPSQADRVACEASGLPWHIVSVPEGHWDTIVPTGYHAALVGREWSHGVLDCYALVRDWYAQEREIFLPDFERHDLWWHAGGNLYLDNYAAAGFTAQPESAVLQVGDVLLMQIASPVPNHAAIYLGENMILHHLQGRLSSRDVYGGYYQKHTTHILRYQNDDRRAAG